jgi:nucleoside-diphosphate-sugar epimerase
MRTVILGGSGLIGTVTAAKLAGLGIAVTIVSRHEPTNIAPGVTWRKGDVANGSALMSLLAEESPACLVHLAASLQFDSEQDPALAVRVNVNGTLHVLEACRQNGISRCVFGSSIAVYGERYDLMREDDPPSSKIGLYGMTKRLGEMLGERYSMLYGLEFVALRYSGVFGPSEVRGKGMARARQQIKECARGQDIVVEGASGDERVHLTHVIDAAEATCRAVLHLRPAHFVYNVAGPDANYMSLNDFYAAIRALVPQAGMPLWQGKGRSAGPVDTRRLREELGVEPRIPVLRGLALDLGLASD